MKPPACVGAFTTTANGLHYVWRGAAGPAAGEATTIGIFNPANEEWTLKPTTGTPPPGRCDGGCTSIGTNIYFFGGLKVSSHFNDLHMINSETFQWSKVHPRSGQPSQPIRKSGCGLVTVNETTLCCFGGYGPSQPGPTFFRDISDTKGCGWTNEFHLFNIQTGTMINTLCWCMYSELKACGCTLQVVCITLFVHDLPNKINF